MIPTDDYAAELRARLAATTPRMSVDLTETIRYGRRRRHRLQATALGGVATVVAAAVLGAPALVDRPTTPPASTATPAPTAGTTRAEADVVTLAPTLRATRAPVPWAEQNGTTWWDTGLAASGEHLLLAGRTAWLGTQQSIRYGYGDPTGDRDLRPYDLAWDPRADVRDHGSGNGYRSQFSTSLGLPGESLELAAGAVPAWMPGARVAITFSYGVPDADGRLRHVFELPTYPDPAGSGAELYSMGGDTSLADMTGAVPRGGTMSGGTWVVFVGADGSTYVNGLAVTPGQLAVWLPQAPVDEVVAGLRAMGATL